MSAIILRLNSRPIESAETNGAEEAAPAPAKLSRRDAALRLLRRLFRRDKKGQKSSKALPLPQQDEKQAATDGEQNRMAEGLRSRAMSSFSLSSLTHHKSLSHRHDDDFKKALKTPVPAKPVRRSSWVSWRSNSVTAEQLPRAAGALTEAELHALFSGAPQFSVMQPSPDKSNVTEHKRPLKPQVLFPWDHSNRINHLSDCRQTPRKAFSLATLRPHVPQHDEDIEEAEKDGPSVPKYDFGTWELPSMFSSTGNEPGTVGFEHYLTLPISDAMKEEADKKTEQRATMAKTAANARKSAKRKSHLVEHHNEDQLSGLRTVENDFVISRLRELGDMYDRAIARRRGLSILKDQSLRELYDHLFTHILNPADRATSIDPDVQYSLKFQIESLIKVLSLKQMWTDFSKLDSRIKLGQTLFDTDDAPEVHTEQTIPEANAMEGPPTPEVSAEKKLLLLQILLACELLVRMDTIAEVRFQQRISISNAENERFNEVRTRKIDWDLILARRWLENVRVVRKPVTASVHLAPSALGGEQEVKFAPRHQKRHLIGLIAFARALRWPDIDLLAPQLVDKLKEGPDGLASLHGAYASRTPKLRPSSAGSDGYLQAPGHNRSLRTVSLSSFSTKSGRNRGHTSKRQSTLFDERRRSMMRTSDFISTTMSPGGWLSRTYFTGLILPGDILPHFLIATLIENDVCAIQKLGGAGANLFGGFQYKNKSWWSKGCVVGRVIAGLGASEEIAGWIGACLPAAGIEDGWVDVRVEAAALRLGKVPAIYDGRGVRGQSAVTGAPSLDGGGAGNAQPKDFTIPYDDVDVETDLDMKLESLHLDPTDQDSLAMVTGEPQPGQPRNYIANLDFVYSFHHSTQRDMTIPPAAETLEAAMPPLKILVELHHDVYFVSAFPCRPPRSSARVVSSPRAHSRPRFGRSLSIQSIWSHKEERQKVPMPAHPLHKSHRYSDKTLSDLLTDLEMGVGGGVGAAHALDPRDTPSRANVWVVNAGGSKDNEVFARAWCASRGFDAVIGRRGKTCLGCCIREAKAMGTGVVLRI